MMHDTRVERLSFYATPPHPCSYLPNREAVTLFADPRFPKTRQLYTALSARGFRRSGEHLYQPHCQGCSACVPVRIPVADYRSNRQQRRTWRRNQDLTVRMQSACYDPEHFALYQRYIAGRHAGGGMDDPTPESYMNFLTAIWSDTIFFEFYDAEQLLAVAATDLMSDAMSAVYTFFDPASASRSLGRFAVLYQIEAARQTGRKWLYLGYWIDNCQKMRYKTEFQPVEYFQQNQWQRTSRE